MWRTMINAQSAGLRSLVAAESGLQQPMQRICIMQGSKVITKYINDYNSYGNNNNNNKTAYAGTSTWDLPESFSRSWLFI